LNSSKIAFALSATAESDDDPMIIWIFIVSHQGIS
jgi:hypothetical protein